MKRPSRSAYAACKAGSSVTEAPAQVGAFVLGGPSVLGERISDYQRREPGKVAIACDQLGYTVLDTECRNMSIVDKVSGGSRFMEKAFENLPMIFRFVKEPKRRRVDDSLEILDGVGHRERRMKRARMTYDPQILVDTGPGYSPRLLAPCQGVQDSTGYCVIWARFDFCIHQDIGVERLHGLDAIQQVEEFVAIAQVDAWLELGLPAL